MLEVKDRQGGRRTRLRVRRPTKIRKKKRAEGRESISSRVIVEGLRGEGNTAGGGGGGGGGGGVEVGEMV